MVSERGRVGRELGLKGLSDRVFAELESMQAQLTRDESRGTRGLRAAKVVGLGADRGVQHARWRVVPAGVGGGAQLGEYPVDTVDLDSGHAPSGVTGKFLKVDQDAERSETARLALHRSPTAIGRDHQGASVSDLTELRTTVDALDQEARDRLADAIERGVEKRFTIDKDSSRVGVTVSASHPKERSR